MSKVSAQLNLPIDIDSNIKKTYTDLSKGSHRYFTCEFNQGGDALSLSKVADKSATFTDFLAEFNDGKCLLAVYHFEYTIPDIGVRNKDIIVTWIPTKAPVKSRMIQSSGGSILKGLCEISIIVQADDMDGLTEEIFLQRALKFNRF